MSKALKVEISPAADRELGKLKERIRKEDFERLRDVIGSLADDPRPQGVRKIKGAEKAYRVRAGSYRVVYEVYDKEKLVLVLHVGKRTETTYR